MLHDILYDSVLDMKAVAAAPQWLHTGNGMLLGMICLDHDHQKVLGPVVSAVDRQYVWTFTKTVKGENWSCGAGE